jgi:hypothetical protein
MAATAIQPSSSPAPAASVVWHALTRVGFRFAFCYLGLYCLITLNNVDEHLAYDRLWHGIVPWVGQHVLHLSTAITYFPSGSGDKMSDWVLLLCHLVISVVATFVWTLFDGRQEYRALNEWLRVALRFCAGWTMVVYGAVKVVKLQFPDPSLGRLLEPLGDFSPMGLLWTFMGYSVPYNFFAGVCELFGVFLFFRRTTTLGALLTAAVMSNVVMLNFAYDVPVKLLSAHVVVMCFYLAAPDMRALFDFFVRNRAAAPVPVRPPFVSKRWRIAAGIAKTLFLGYIFIGSAMEIRQGVPQYGSGAPKSPLYGIWDVEEFVRDGQTLPPLLTDQTRWKRFVTQRPNGVSLRGMDDSTKGYEVRFDVPKSAIIGTDPKAPLTLTWSRPDADHLTLTGTVDGHQVSARMKRMDESKSNLLGRGFHWVSERPFNR